MSWRRMSLRLIAVASAALLAGPIAALYAQADEVRPPFYEVPSNLPHGSGAIVRSEPMTYYLDPAKLITANAKTTRIMYTSTDRTGKPIGVTGVLAVPNTPWSGSGQRPLVSYAAGTQGMADRCAPSRQIDNGAEYESAGVNDLLLRGYAVVLTDYQGLGTPGLHTYMNRAVQGHVVLDAARAAKNLPGSDLDKNAPIGIVGYSQGGGAAASAAELASSYAPELDIKGAVAGAVPADLGPVGAHLDGGPYAQFLLMAISGLAEGYQIDADSLLNDRGKQVRKQIDDSCVSDVAKFAFTKSETLSADGRPIADYFQRQPFKDVLADNVIGTHKPSMPVLQTHSIADDVIPFQVGKDLAKRWCDLGANLQFSNNAFPTHVGAALPNYAQELAYLGDRFAGKPAVSNCGSA